MSALRHRITAAKVQAVAEALERPARELGLIGPAHHIVTYRGDPWEAMIVSGDGADVRERPAFLPRELGATAAEAHASLTAAFHALREASHVDRERIIRRALSEPDPLALAFDRGEISARELQRRRNAPTPTHAPHAPRTHSTTAPKEAAR